MGFYASPKVTKYQVYHSFMSSYIQRFPSRFMAILAVFVEPAFPLYI